MATTILAEHLKEVNGQAQKNGVVYRTKHYQQDGNGHTRVGKTEAYSRTPRNWKKNPATAGEMASRNKFAAARQQMKIELSDAERRAFWQAKFKKQKKYVRLDCYVIAELIKGGNE